MFEFGTVQMPFMLNSSGNGIIFHASNRQETKISLKFFCVGTHAGSRVTSQRPNSPPMFPPIG